MIICWCTRITMARTLSYNKYCNLSTTLSILKVLTITSLQNFNREILKWLCKTHLLWSTRQRLLQSSKWCWTCRLNVRSKFKLWSLKFRNSKTRSIKRSGLLKMRPVPIIYMRCVCMMEVLIRVTTTRLLRTIMQTYGGNSTISKLILFLRKKFLNKPMVVKARKQLFGWFIYQGKKLKQLHSFNCTTWPKILITVQK